MRIHSHTNRVSMPKWPAWALFGAMAACAYPAVSASVEAEPAPRASAEMTSPASVLAR